MAQTLQTLSIISFSIAGVLLVVSIFLWFFFKIPTVIGDLSGRTARKSIAKMRATNEKTGKKSYKESRANVERGKVTGTMPGMDNTNSQSSSDDDKPETGMLVDNKADGIETEATGILDSNETAPLVNNNSSASNDKKEEQPIKRSGGKKLIMIKEVMIIHTEEVV